MIAIRPFESRRVPSANRATIAVADWPGAKGPLVCVHGLTSSSRAFVGLATVLSDYRILAIDCRGRGESSKEGPFGILQHAADLAAVLDHAGIERATLVGHSMGAYIAGAFCALYGERVQRIVFIDGGYSQGLPAGVSPDDVLQAVLGPFLEKMRRSWDSLDEYVKYYESIGLYPDGVDEIGRAHLAYDLKGDRPPLTSKIVDACIGPDWRDALDEPTVTKRLQEIQVPLLVLRAPGGLTGKGDEVMPGTVRDAILARVPHATFFDIPKTNHHTILLSLAGASEVAHAIKRWLGDD